jgi:hypothetical protein
MRVILFHSMRDIYMQNGATELIGFDLVKSWLDTVLYWNFAKLYTSLLYLIR